MTVNGTEYTEAPEQTQIETPDEIAAASETRRSLEEDVQTRLADVFTEDDEVDEDPAGEEDEVEDVEDDVDEDEPVDAPEPEDEVEDVEDDEADEAEEGEEADAQAAAAEVEVDPDAPTLPDPYRRSLKARGWDDEEIDQNLRVMGDKFVSIAGRVHQSRNDELATFAAAGRQAKQTPPQADPDPAAADTPAPSGVSVPAAVDGQALKAGLKEKYGEDELIDELVDGLLTPVNGTIQAINAIIPSLQQGQQAAEQAANDQVVKQVENFFTADALTPYQEFYGEPGNMTDAQVQHRNEVLDRAFEIRLGAEQLRGQRLSIDDALSMAHELVSRDFKETAVRRKITKTAKKRQQGISLKPSKTKGSGDTGAPSSRSGLESKVSKRLASVFK